jgi:phosphoglycolate phosphatase-like HAD superfamily hydrolase
MANGGLAWLQRFKLVFWDFDGVIKESVGVKGDAFRELFAAYGQPVAQAVVAHHFENGGMPRREKIMHALRHFAGIAPDAAVVDDLVARFGKLVQSKVVNSAWVPGAEALLKTNPFAQSFILLTATPQQEIQWILDQLEIRGAFLSVFGSPVKKTDAMRASLAQYGVAAKDAVFLGDSRSDLEAAAACGVEFVLRETGHASDHFRDFGGRRIPDFAVGP